MILLSSTINAQTINSKGKITEKTDDYVIYVVFQEKHLLEKAIPTEVINHCEGLTPKKNTYLFNHDYFKGSTPISWLDNDKPDVYRYICAATEDWAVNIRTILLSSKIDFNERALKRYEENNKNKFHIFGAHFKDHRIIAFKETDEYISNRITARMHYEKVAKERAQEEERQKRLNYLQNIYGAKCSKNKANNVEYNKCLNDQEQIAKKEKAIQEAKQVEENKKKQLIAEKQKAEEDKLNKMLANMKPEERRAYVCEKTYGLRKGSDKFSECVYKILAADVELEKIELQKKLAEAQLETAKANEAAARANAAASASRGNVSSYDPNVAAAMDRANEIERAKILLNLSQALRTPSASPQFNAPPRQQNCKLNPYNNRITCY